MELGKIRYLKHPYLIRRNLFGSPEDEKIDRVREYKTFTIDTMQFYSSLNYKQYRIPENLETHLVSCNNEISGRFGAMSMDFLTSLYSIVRNAEPEIVVETGIASGFSSCVTLQALKDNCKGRLYSIDLHYRDGIFFPKGRKLGWVIPQALRINWNVRLGESHNVLPRLLSKMEVIDIFLHDSRHSYKNMLLEYSLAWPKIRNGGFLLSDDVTMNDAFLDFSNTISEMPLVLFGKGILRKGSGLRNG